MVARARRGAQLGLQDGVKKGRHGCQAEGQREAAKKGEGCDFNIGVD